MKKILKSIKDHKIVILISVFLGFVFFIFNPTKIRSANFTSAYGTLSNARFSYRAGIASGSSGSTTVTIDSTSNADNDTNHLFPGDTVCFTNVTPDGCTGNKTYTVATIATGNTITFNLTTALTDDLDATGYVMATQSGTLTLNFTSVNEVPVGGDLYITIPVVDTASQVEDGFPDTNSTVATNGFDTKGLVVGDLAVTGCTDAYWDTANATITQGNGTTDTTIKIPRITGTCAVSTALQVTISNNHIRNPAPSTEDSTRGIAEAYQINIKSRDSGANTLDESDVVVTPIEAVLISATVDETLALTVEGITADSGSYCGTTRTSSSPDSTATSIPWGSISPTYAEATHNAQQVLTVSTNAGSGYKVYIEENDQMGKDGATCTGASADENSSPPCIKDTVCGGTACTHVVAYDWGADPTNYPGLGYSLVNVSGSDAKFIYNSDQSPCDNTGSGGNFCAKQLADQEASENRADSGAEIMLNTGPVETNSIDICYRLDITGTQPAGYYYNVAKYTAVATF